MDPTYPMVYSQSSSQAAGAASGRSCNPCLGDKCRLLAQLCVIASCPHEPQVGTAVTHSWVTCSVKIHNQWGRIKLNKKPRFDVICWVTTIPIGRRYGYGLWSSSVQWRWLNVTVQGQSLHGHIAPPQLCWHLDLEWLLYSDNLV